MPSLQNTRAIKFMDQLPGDRAVFGCEYKLGLSFPRNTDLRVFIDISIGMTGNRDRFFPGAHIRFNPPDDNRAPEYRAIHDCADCPVRTLPHLFQSILPDPVRVWGNGGTFDRNTEAKRGLSSLRRNPVVRLISPLQSKIIVFRLQIHKRPDQFLFDHLPEDPGHLISIHLNERGCHPNFTQNRYLFFLLLPKQIIPRDERFQPASGVPDILFQIIPFFIIVSLNRRLVLFRIRSLVTKHMTVLDQIGGE